MARAVQLVDSEAGYSQNPVGTLFLMMVRFVRVLLLVSGKPSKRCAVEIPYGVRPISHVELALEISTFASESFE